MNKLICWLDGNLDMFYRLSKDYFKANLTSEQLRSIALQRKHNSGGFDSFVKREFYRFMLDKAERILLQRRLKIR